MTALRPTSQPRRTCLWCRARSASCVRRYQNEVGKGRFKKVYKGFDERRGIDIAWSKLSGASLALDEQQLAAVAQVQLVPQLSMRCLRQQPAAAAAALACRLAGQTIQLVQALRPSSAGQQAVCNNQAGRQSTDRYALAPHF